MIKLYQHRGARTEALQTETQHENMGSATIHVRKWMVRNRLEDGDVCFERLDYPDQDYTHSVNVRCSSGNTYVYGFARFYR